MKPMAGIQGKWGSPTDHVLVVRPGQLGGDLFQEHHNLAKSLATMLYIYDKNPLGHFTALTPLNGFVWELDSLQTELIKIGRLPKGADWKRLAFEYADSFMSSLPQYDRKCLTRHIAIVATV
ncbi:hypothetical protein BGZ79_008006 [Entomortierella chlamydospora]|nr:hypothetical protein BGZ79_008006 [Entomortierella chlamydospora]